MPGTASRLTQSFITDVAERVRIGAQPQAVIIAMGVPQRTASRWLAVGRGEQLPEGEEPGSDHANQAGAGIPQDLNNIPLPIVL